MSLQFIIYLYIIDNPPGTPSGHARFQTTSPLRVRSGSLMDIEFLYILENKYLIANLTSLCDVRQFKINLYNTMR